MLFEQKKSDFLPAMLLGVAVGGTLGAGAMVVTDKKKMDALKKTADSAAKKISGFVDSILP